MKLAQRLLLGSLLLIGALTILLAAVVDRRVSARMIEQMRASLAREGRLVGTQWTGDTDADSLADAAGAALGAHVTLIDRSGRIAGDSEVDGAELARLPSASEPEVADAARTGVGAARRRDSPGGPEAIHVAVRVERGIARVSVPTRLMNDMLGRIRRDILLAGLVALVVAGITASLFARSVSGPIAGLSEVASRIAAGDLARSVSGPIAGLSEVASRIAAGDLARRARLDAPAEVGELAAALNRMADELAARFRALEADDALLATLIESLNEGVIALDASGRIVRINDGGRRLLSLEVPTPMPADYLPRERVLHEAVRAALDGEPTEPIEIGVAGRTLALTARPLAGGGAVLTLFDLTPLRRLEMMRRDFVANASHELKTPLTIIGGFAETLAQDDPPGEQRRQFARTILAHTARMQRLVDDLLDLSRIESGGWTPNPVGIDVHAAAEEVVAPKRDAARARAVAIDVEIASGAEQVQADPTALRQILVNLLDNALRHTERGRIRIVARPADGAIELAIEDTGSGIAPRHLGRIFERFYRADPARSREAGGTGLGLAIVKHLVEAHGGHVRAESTPGRGTTVRVSFPRPPEGAAARV